MILRKDGFRGNGRTSCVNIDECRLREHNCNPNALCMDLTEGGFTCECNDGWKGNGVECFDIDECLRLIFKYCALIGLAIGQSKPSTLRRCEIFSNQLK